MTSSELLSELLRAQCEMLLDVLPDHMENFSTLPLVEIGVVLGYAQILDVLGEREAAFKALHCKEELYRLFYVAAHSQLGVE